MNLKKSWIHKQNAIIEIYAMKLQETILGLRFKILLLKRLRMLLCNFRERKKIRLYYILQLKRQFISQRLFFIILEKWDSFN